MKKGAMFGLDARIALAIFGALSVISGAALYSAIKNTKATSLLTEAKEVAKSYEAYYIDTGSDLAISADNTAALMLSHLKQHNITGWKGPYTSLDKSSDNEHTLLSILYPNSKIHVYLMDDAQQIGGATNPSTSTHSCDSGEKCTSWVRYDHVPYNLLQIIDKIVDGTVDDDSGNFRYIQRTDDTSEGRLFLKISSQF